MYRPRLVLGGFGLLHDEGQLIVVRSLLETMAIANWQILKRRPDLPELYDVRPRYLVRPRGGEDEWQDIVATFSRGSGTCKDFACIRVAEMRMRGMDDVVPFIKLAVFPDPKGQRQPLTLFHVMVRAGDNLECPSALLGMKDHVTYDELRGHPDAGGVPDARWGLQQWAAAP